MRLLVLVSLFAAAFANAIDVTPSVYNYHELVGIPEVSRIQDAEELILRNGAQRIVGGAASSMVSHPYLAGLVINFVNIAGRSGCGASLLSQNRLVTAAHCWFDGVNQASMFTVVLGSEFLFNGGTRITTSTVIPHPNYNAFVSALVNDVAMIYLPSNIAYTANIQPVALPSTLDLSNQFNGQWATAVGFGKTTDLEASLSLSTYRREVNLQVITVQQCQSTYGSNVVLDSNICTSGLGNVGICGGDSGGPLTVFNNGQHVLIGISSFVASGQCHVGHPSAFARVTSFYSFILQHLF